jgi:DNA-binding LacI/PurR family transcriptional regulator
MSMREVAQLAGVSVSTVSRVANDHPNIAATTSESVRNAMAQLKFVPQLRNFPRRIVLDSSRQSIGFVVFGQSASNTAPSFHKLLRGVSDAARDLNSDLVFSFVSHASDLPRSIADARVGGLLVHGQRPSPSIERQLADVPTVWLMANRERPQWGDQVMPNNPVVGEMAVKYLAQRGHRRLACLKAAGDGWSLRLRAWAFTAAASEAGIDARVVEVPEAESADVWCSIGLARTADRLVNELLSSGPVPTGLFILEDRLLPVVDAALAARGLRAGRGKDVEMISCNNERAPVPGLYHPATLDLRADVIGRRGVELLLWRMRNTDFSERVSLLIEPELVESKSSD